MNEPELIERGRLAGGGRVRWGLGFCYLGGALAWTFHLVALWAVAEWRCSQPEPDPLILGVTGTALLVLAFSLLAASIAAAALWSARLAQRATPPEGEPRAHLARAGLLMNAVFLWIIVLQTVPVFFYLERC